MISVASNDGNRNTLELHGKLDKVGAADVENGAVSEKRFIDNSRDY